MSESPGVRDHVLGSVSSTVKNRPLFLYVSPINCRPYCLNTQILPLPFKRITSAQQEEASSVSVLLSSFLLLNPLLSFLAYDQLICMRMTFVAPVISSDNGQLAKRI